MIGPHRWTVEEDRAFQADSKVKMGRALLMCTAISGQAGGGNELRLWQRNIVSCSRAGQEAWNIFRRDMSLILGFKLLKYSNSKNMILI